MIKYLTGVFLIFFLAALILPGCKASQKIQGGTAQHDSGGFVMTYAPPGGGQITIKDDRERIATTEPSVNVTGDQLKVQQQASKGEGLLGGFTIDAREIKDKPTAWGLIAALAIMAIAFYFLHNYIGVAICIGGIILAFIAPAVLVWIVVAALVFLIFINRKVIFQLVKGNQDALPSIPPQNAEKIKTVWADVQDNSTKKVVNDVKRKV